MSYSILKGPILAPGQYKYVSLIRDDAVTGQIDQVSVIRTDISEGINRLVEVSLGDTDSDQELLNFFQTFLTNFRAVPGIRVVGSAALMIASLLGNSNLTWTFGATLRVGTRSINSDSLRQFDARGLDPSATDYVLDLKAST